MRLWVSAHRDVPGGNRNGRAYRSSLGGLRLAILLSACVWVSMEIGCAQLDPRGPTPTTPPSERQTDNTKWQVPEAGPFGPDLSVKFTFAQGYLQNDSAMIKEKFLRELTRRGFNIAQNAGHELNLEFAEPLAGTIGFPLVTSRYAKVSLDVKLRSVETNHLLVTARVDGLVEDGQTSRWSSNGKELMSRAQEIAVSKVGSELLALSAGSVHVDPGSVDPPLGPVREELVTGPVGQRWAVCIGISQYKYAGRKLSNLKYAAKDVQDMAAFLKSEAGGKFPADHVMLLIDQGATKQNITDALFNFLKHTVKEDLVIIQFSGHGSPDPEKLSNLYIVAHDTDPDRIASTGFPMWDLDTALHRSIGAQRVIVLADTCHSAGVTEGVKGTRIGREFNKYFEGLSKSKPGRVTFTSCEGYEVSMESDKWGGGHGVFTWAVLEALRGKAHVNKDGIVTLGEMLDYVDVTVRRETADEQHPARAGAQFDRNLPMGVVK
jgi:hypothetical protein